MDYSGIDISLQLNLKSSCLITLNTLPYSIHFNDILRNSQKFRLFPVSKHPRSSCPCYQSGAFNNQNTSDVFENVKTIQIPSIRCWRTQEQSSSVQWYQELCCCDDSIVSVWTLLLCTTNKQTRRSMQPHSATQETPSWWWWRCEELLLHCVSVCVSIPKMIKIVFSCVFPYTYSKMIRLFFKGKVFFVRKRIFVEFQTAGNFEHAKNLTHSWYDYYIWLLIEFDVIEMLLRQFWLLYIYRKVQRWRCINNI